ncbi:MAG: phasin family protein [Pseudomonadota bacterium]
MAKANGKSKATTKEFEALTQMPTDSMKKSFDQMMSFGSDMTEMNRSGFQAMAESAKAAGKGLETMSSKNMEFMKDTIERNVEATRALSGITSMEDAAEAQAKFAKEAFQSYMGQMNEMANLFVTTMREAVEPLNAQATNVVEKFQMKA